MLKRPVPRSPIQRSEPCDANDHPRVPALLLAAFLAACSAMPSATPEASGLEGTAWILSAFPGQTLPPGQMVTLRFEGGHTSGSDGCNRYRAPYASKGQALEVSPRGVSTMMTCPSETMQLARDFTATLRDTRSW